MTAESNTVLVVNDDPVQLRFTAAILEKEGWQVSTTLGAEEAFNLIAQNYVFDLIISDLHMPNIDGWRFCRLLRSPEFKAFNNIPIILMSATFSGIDAESITRDLGANGFLAAPFKPQVLINYVNAVMRGEAPAAQSKVLIVEDSSSQAKIIQREFESHGYSTIIASTAAQAQTLYAEYQHEIVILDYYLPDGTGDIILSDFKQPGGKTIVVVVTTSSDPQKALQLIQMGADGYVRKPFDPAYLVDLTEKARREFSFIRVEQLLEHRSKELTQSNKRFKNLFEYIPEIVILREISGTIIEINANGAKQLETQAASLIGKNINSLIVKEEAEENGSFLQDSYSLTTYFLTKSGRHLPVEINESKINYEGREVYLMVARNIFFRQKRGEEALRAQKLESLSVISAGITHDFNNLLTAIIGNLSMAKIQENLDPVVEQFISKAETAANRVKDLTQQLSTFASGGEAIKKPVDLNQLLGPTLRFSLRGSSVSSEMKVEGDIHMVNADEGQIRQVVHSLAVNAIQAMPNGGRIHLSARNCSISEADHLTLPPGEYVEIIFSDEGSGILPDHLPKIFDPFFTTKAKRSGLGLASSYSIVKNHGGSIEVTSKINHGTQVKILFPAVTEVKTAPEEKVSSVVGGSENILIMDDEKDVLDVTLEMLKSMGYSVQTTGDGESAVEEYKAAIERGNPYDLVIMDLTVPGGMGGREALEEIKKFDPEVSAIVASGYSEAPIMSEFEKYGFKGCVRKPYTLLELSRTIKKTI